MDTVEVAISKGNVVFKKPNAGLRNKHLEAAETEKGIRFTKFLMNLLPDCVVEHPFGAGKKIKDELDKLSVEEYDALIDAFTPLAMPKKGDAEKKSEMPSGQAESPETQK